MKKTRNSHLWVALVVVLFLEATQQQVDAEIDVLLMSNTVLLVSDILENNQDIAHAMVKALLEWETIDRDQIRDIIEECEPQPPKVYVAEKSCD